jgi:hypothetical protein
MVRYTKITRKINNLFLKANKFYGSYSFSELYQLNGRSGSENFSSNFGSLGGVVVWSVHRVLTAVNHGFSRSE